MKMEQGSASVLDAPPTDGQAGNEQSRPSRAPCERERRRAFHPGHLFGTGTAARRIFLCRGRWGRRVAILSRNQCAAPRGSEHQRMPMAHRQGLGETRLRDDDEQRRSQDLSTVCQPGNFPKRTCFVITDRGIVCANETSPVGCQAHAGEHRVPASVPTVRPSSDNGESQPATPTWDSDRQQLRVGRIVVKEFKVPAANQESDSGRL